MCLLPFDITFEYFMIELLEKYCFIVKKINLKVLRSNLRSFEKK